MKIENYYGITNEKSHHIVTLPFDKDFPLLKVNFDIDSAEVEVEGIRFTVVDCIVSDNGESINLVCEKLPAPSILKMSAKAQEYYESLRALSLAQGWDKYVATDGTTCMFVKSDYEPQNGEAVFFLTTRNRFTSIQLYKTSDLWKQRM